MSSNSLALLRKNAGQDIAALAEEHFKHDLQDSDRDILKSAASKISVYVSIGSVVGLGLGALPFDFDDRGQALPDIIPFLKPSTLSGVAAYTTFGFGGFFISRETGILTGSTSAGRTISRDPETRERIETAFRRFRADVLRKEADALDKRKETYFDIFLRGWSKEDQFEFLQEWVPNSIEKQDKDIERQQAKSPLDRKGYVTAASKIDFYLPPQYNLSLSNFFMATQIRDLESHPTPFAKTGISTLMSIKVAFGSNTVLLKRG
ncbi:MAG: hypothetical protein Q9181_000211 [Wetmoreana brouardii]